jgi:cytochrome c2/plastocyanin
MVWLVLVDYLRPWKEHQSTHMDNEAVLAELKFLTTQQASFQQKIEGAEKRVEQCRRDVDLSSNEDYARIIGELTRSKDELYGRDLDFKQKDAIIVVARARYEEALALHGAEHEDTRSAWENLQALEHERLESKLAKEKIEDRIAKLNHQRKEIEQPFEDATRELSFLQKEVDEARARRKKFSSQIYRKGLNIPLLDFAAPEGTPGKFEVKQIVAQDVKLKLNFLEGYRVDRCTTCHVVIDNKNFAPRELASQFEKFIPAIAEELAQRGDPQAPVVQMVPPPEVFGVTEDQLFGHVAAHWDLVAPPEQEDYLQALQQEINKYLTYAGLPTLELDQPLRAHPHLDLYLTENSPHPIKRMGCTVCHEGNGQETDFVLAAHAPKSKREEEEWADKYYDRNLGVPRMTWHTLEHFWDFPMIPPKYSESSCAKCHNNIHDLARFNGQTHAAKLREGRKLFTQTGCINCHLVQDLEGSPQVGTDLTHVASKLDEAFMHKWIMNPREFRASTWMPHFYLQENNGPGSANPWDPEPVLRTQTEVIAITAYLRHVSKSWQPEPLPSGPGGDVRRGQELFATVGCLGCHGNIAEYGDRWIADDRAHALAVEERRTVAADFQTRLEEFSRRIDRRSELKLDEAEVQDLHRRYAALVDERDKRPTRQAKDFLEQAEDEAAAMGLNEQTHYAMEHFSAARRHEAEARAAQERMQASITGREPDPLLTYVPPVFTRFAPDLSAIGTKVSPAWLYTWLREPRHYSASTKMPSLRLTPQEALDLTAYLSTLKHDTFKPQALTRTADVIAELDRRLDDILGGQNSEATVALIKNDEGNILTSMLETDIGALSPEATLTDKKMLMVGRKMIAYYGCFACHNIQGFEGTARPGTELTEWGEKNLHQLDFAFFSGAYEETLGHDPRFQRLYPESRPDLLRWHGLAQDLDIEVQHTRSSFATYKLLNPRIWDRDKIKRPYEKLKMPNFYFSESDSEALVTFLLSRRPPRVAETLKIDYQNGPAGPMARGRALLEEFNCVGCHKIEDNVATIHQFITVAKPKEDEDWDEWGEEEEEGAKESADAEQPEGRKTAPASHGVELTRLGVNYGGDFDAVNGPPWLRGEGAKVQPGWFFNFLLNVETLRPWKDLKVRMPSFYLTSEQSAAIVDYFSAASQTEARQLNGRLHHIEQVVSKAPGGEAQWYLDADLTSDAVQLSRYAVDNSFMLARSFDFRGKSPEDVQAIHAELLNGARFFGNLYDIRHPFDFADFHWMNPDRFNLGSSLFQELRCLSCHVLGDPAVPGSNPNPTAPNLNLAHKRLRYDWFVAWLQDPGRIQPGTKMPQWFPGGRSAYAAYSDDLRIPFEKKYGSNGDDQLHLLLDYVWQAGLMNATAVQGNAAAAPAAQQASTSGAAPTAAAAESQPPPATASAPAHETGNGGEEGATTPPAPSREAGSIRGRVVWRGEAPRVGQVPVAGRDQAACGTDPRPINGLELDPGSGAMGGCVVYLVAAPGKLPSPETVSDPQPVKIHNCTWSPAVSLVTPGTSLRFVNEDDITHHLVAHSGDTQLWSRDLVGRGSEVALALNTPGLVTVRSKGLDWMTHHVWVIDHAAYACTAADGTFDLPDIPPGDYTVHVWHPGWTLQVPEGAGQGPAKAIPVVAGGKARVASGQPTELTIEMKE